MRNSEIEYWEKVSDRGLNDNIHKRQAIVKRLLDVDLIGKDILEVGCGAGTAFGALNVMLLGNFRYLGTDLSDKWVKGMKKYWDLRAVQADITEIPTEANQFDVVVALDTLEHVRPEDRAAGYQELRRVMKVGAKLLINMPLEETKHNLEFDHSFGVQDISDITEALEGRLITFEQYTVECVGGPRSYVWVVIESRKGGRAAGPIERIDERCEERDGDGFRCIYPAGHKASHGSLPNPSAVDGTYFWPLKTEPTRETSGLAQVEEAVEVEHQSNDAFSKASLDAAINLLKSEGGILENSQQGTDGIAPSKKVFEIRTPWDNAWIPLYKQVIEAAGHIFVLNKGWPSNILTPDVVFHMWADNVEPFEGAVNYVFMRRYELYSTKWLEFDWSKIDKFIFCNQWIMERAQEAAMRAGVKLPPCELVMNVASPDVWTFKEREPGKNIGMACHVHPKKNLSLAAQIMMEFPEDYRLHIAGDIQDPFTADYMHNLLGDQVRFYGHIPRESLDTWWDGMNYCLSTSISEGNPNNVIEAMAKGIKPVVHCWPGADQQFPTFRTVFDAVKMIREVGSYTSKKYKGIVDKFHSLDNYKRIVEDAITQAERKG